MSTKENLKQINLYTKAILCYFQKQKGFSFPITVYFVLLHRHCYFVSSFLAIVITVAIVDTVRC